MCVTPPRYLGACRLACTDLAWEKEGTVFVAEVKSITHGNEGQQLRLGLGQVLRYRQRLGGLGYQRVVAVLVPERAPRDSSWRGLCHDLGVILLARNEIDQAPQLLSTFDPYTVPRGLVTWALGGWPARMPLVRLHRLHDKELKGAKN